MFLNTLFIHDVETIEIVKETMYSGDGKYQQSKIVIRSTQGEACSETEIFLMSKPECKLTFNVLNMEELNS